MSLPPSPSLLDTDLLQDLSQGAIAQTKLDALVAQQKKSLDHALKCECVTRHTCKHALV